MTESNAKKPWSERVRHDLQFSGIFWLQFSGIFWLHSLAAGRL
jgi:hypothetical protein